MIIDVRYNRTSWTGILPLARRGTLKIDQIKQSFLSTAVSRSSSSTTTISPARQLLSAPLTLVNYRRRLTAVEAVDARTCPLVWSFAHLSPAVVDVVRDSVTYCVQCAVSRDTL
ncbi:hypothetical protein PoB_000561200 [Plakobranchus ocellatus]|uniref:Uncharacterized protein n=1 Tax=Plakobranchus ocellatus TaxID=259542 RepID=A0AAV3Y9H9_9GAST|nr:hypothetical protein PoB_000561200 [Plakobranchus ocellatus]